MSLFSTATVFADCGKASLLVVLLVDHLLAPKRLVDHFLEKVIDKNRCLSPMIVETLLGLPLRSGEP